MTKKTIAMRLLEGKKISYVAVPYPAEMRDAEEIAAWLKVSAAQLYKTLVVVRSLGKPMLIMMPSNLQLDLKKFARLVKEKKVKMASHQEAENLTGLQVGGISALALVNKGFAIYLEEGAQQFEEIYISAGERGLDVKLAVSDLVKVTKARFVAAAR